MNYLTFQNIFLQVLNTHAPVKQKVQRFNNNRFMTKQLRKVIMRHSRLKNIYKKTRSPENWNSYKKQRNFCVDHLRKTKRSYFEQININDISDNKKFWNTIKPLFSNKGLNSNKLMLIENDKLISEEPLLARTMNEYFTNITKNLILKPSPRFSDLKYINFYQNHISIIKIMSQSNSEFESFHFQRLASNKIKKEILNLNNKKATREGDIPENLLNGSIGTYLLVLTEIINSSFEQNEFPNELKLADIIPLIRKIIDQ